MGRYRNTVTQGVHLSKDEWLTPPSIIQKLGPFDLDPCASKQRPWETASRYFTEDDIGLVQNWVGFVWMNPPYGKGLPKWVEKLAQHGNGLGLIPLRSTDTKWFHKNVWDTATAVLFYRGRIKFWDTNGVEAGSSPHASLFLAYGEEAAERLEASGLPGKFLRLYLTPARELSTMAIVKRSERVKRSESIARTRPYYRCSFVLSPEAKTKGSKASSTSK